MNREAVEHAIRVLNEALASGPDAMHQFIHMGVPVHLSLAEHPSIQVGKSLIAPKDGDYVMHPLGLINGLFGVDDNEWGYIYMTQSDAGEILSFGLKPQ